MATDITNDSELWQLVKQDDRIAYEQLYRRYVALLYAEVFKRIRHQTDAEDIVQDIFLSLWEKRARVELKGRLFSYLYGMAQNKVFNYYRDKKIPVDYLEIWETLPEVHAALVEQPAAFREAELATMETLIEAERRNLPPRMRQVYELRYEKEMSPQEIAEQLILSPNTVRNHLKEVRKRFMGAIKKTSFFLVSLLY